MTRTDGQRLLREWLAADTSRSQSSLAKALGLNQSSVSDWIAGISRPDTVMRAALHERCGIDEATWLSTSERKQLSRLRRTGTDG